VFEKVEKEDPEAAEPVLLGLEGALGAEAAEGLGFCCRLVV
jgi:hypothetical protein